MSNLLPAAEAEVCESAPQSKSIEALPDRTVRLGSLDVHRVLPVRGRRLIGPFCFFDRFGPLRFETQKPMDVAPHPHIGLQTVTWLFSGEVVHNDSLGSECLVRPGQLSLMTAGRGIAHTEETPLDNSGHLDGVQLWVALPEPSRAISPIYQCTAGQPVVEHAGVTATTILGEYEGTASSGKLFNPGICVDLAIHPGATAELPLQRQFEYGVLLASGDAMTCGTHLQLNTLYYLGAGRDSISIQSASGARLLLIGGTPFGETILMWWNFVARTAEEITSARSAWENRELFGEVLRYNGPRLTAPAFLGRPIPS